MWHHLNEKCGTHDLFPLELSLFGQMLLWRQETTPLHATEHVPFLWYRDDLLLLNRCKTLWVSFQCQCQWQCIVCSLFVLCIQEKTSICPSPRSSAVECSAIKCGRRWDSRWDCWGATRSHWELWQRYVNNLFHTNCLLLLLLFKARDQVIQIIMFYFF